MALNTFIARLTKESYQRQNKYRVQINAPWGAMGYDMALFAETVEIPGQTIISSPDELRAHKHNFYMYSRNAGTRVFYELARYDY